MHHTIRLYSRHREFALRFYMFWARLSGVPLLGWLIRGVANSWGRNLESAYLLTTAEAEEIVDISGKLAVGPCTCREVYGKCDNPVDAEIILSLDGNVFIEERPQDYREISKEEAREILRDCHERGLIHTIVSCRGDYYAICNCCACCCVPLRLRNRYGIGSALTRDPEIVQVFREHGCLV